MVYPVILAPAFIPELNAVTHTEEGECCDSKIEKKIHINLILLRADVSMLACLMV